MLKRKLAALLAGAMVLTSLPMVSFAASDNRLDKSPMVKSDHKFTFATAPRLEIKEKDSDWVDYLGNPANQTIRLKFENAKWIGEDEDKTFDGTEKFVYKKLTDTLVEFTLKGTSSEDKVEIPLITEMTGTGDVKVTVDPLDSKVSGGSYIFATTAEGSTNTWIDGVEKFPDDVKIKPLIIEELKIGSIKHDAVRKVTLTLTSGFEFSSTALTMEFAGGFKGTSTNQRSKIDDIVNDGDYFVRFADSDHEELEVYFNVPNAGKRGTIVLDNINIKATEDADLGDVEITISGDDVTGQDITVAEYVEYGVTVKAEDKDVPELLAGEDEGNQKDDHKLLKLTIEENITDSWLTTRRTEISFPDGIKIYDVKIDANDDTNITDGTVVKNAAVEAGYTTNATINKDKNMLTLQDFTINPNKKGKIEFELWVSVEADYVGDIVATVGGPALEEDTEVVLGKAIAPVEVTVEKTDMKIGYKEVDGGKITITETKAGALKKNEQLILALEDIDFDDDADIEVTVDGEARVKEDVSFATVDGNDAIVIDITRESKKEPSTITIEGAVVKLNRAVPYGEYDLRVGGDAIVRNNHDTNAWEFKDSDYVVTVPYINIITPPTDELEQGVASKQKATFTVGSADYTVGEEVATADAAPYIKDGRTMIPVKYAAYALGIDPSNIKWDQTNKTVTILGDRVIQVKVGSKDLLVSGATLTMDAAAEVVDGRTYLPISWVASALNVNYSYDDATKTVTFN